MMFGLILGGVVIILGVYLLTRTSRPNLPPGPEPSSYLLGNLKELGTSVHQNLHALSQKYGPIYHLRILNRDVIVLNSADAIKKAFRSEKYRELLNDKAKGFFGTYLMYGHKDVLLGPYHDRTFKLKSVMRKGLLPNMDKDDVQREVTELLECIKIQKEKILIHGT